MPPAKRARGETDVYPTWMLLPVCSVTAANPTDTLFVQFGAIQTPNLPLQRLANAQGKAWVIEVLGAFFHPITVNLSSFNTGTGVSQDVQVYVKVGTTSSAFNNTGVGSAAGANTDWGSWISDPTEIASVTWVEETSQSVVSSIGIPTTQSLLQSRYVDLSDGAGHGMLVATDRVYLQAGMLISSISSGTMGTNTFSCACRLKYRIKEVSTLEFVGIVQAQQMRT